MKFSLFLLAGLVTLAGVGFAPSSHANERDRSCARETVVYRDGDGTLRYGRRRVGCAVEDDPNPRDPVVTVRRNGVVVVGNPRTNVPNGHLPPPGECRVWFANRPAGQQPPPVDCDRLLRYR